MGGNLISAAFAHLKDNQDVQKIETGFFFIGIAQNGAAGVRVCVGRTVNMSVLRGF